MTTINRFHRSIQTAELSYSVNGSELFVEGAWTHPAHRCQGITTSCMQEMIAANTNATVIALTCTPSSKRKWRKMGFAFKGDRGTMSVISFNNKYGSTARASNTQAVSKRGLAAGIA